MVEEHPTLAFQIAHLAMITAKQRTLKAKILSRCQLAQLLPLPACQGLATSKTIINKPIFPALAAIILKSLHQAPIKLQYMITMLSS